LSLQWHKFPLYFFLLLSCFLKPSVTFAGLVINEFLADPNGSDGGKEFVELLSTGPGAFNLSEVQFQFANGSVGPQWETRWSFSGQRWLAEGERFLLVDRNWMGPEPFDVEVGLGLQNGPDAIRIVQGSQVLDMVGYGQLTDPAMVEGSAVALPVGLSLMRKPDGRDTGDNSLDFHAGLPTAGSANYQDYAMEAVTVEMDPPSLAEVGGSILLKVLLWNSGLQDLQPAEASVVLQSGSGQQTRVLDTFYAGCSADGSSQLSVVFIPVSKGRFSVILQLHIQDSTRQLEVCLGNIQVGCGAAFLSEILSTPASHQGEWIEIQAGAEGADLRECMIRDEDGDWRALPPVELRPHEFLLVAQDSVALHGWHHENLMSGLIIDCPVDQLNMVLREMPSSWPSLNNSAPDGRNFADRVYLADGLGIIDHFTLPGDENSADSYGNSWERRSHDPHSLFWPDWRPSVAVQGGTPGCNNSVGAVAVSSGVLKIEPRVLDAHLGESVAHVRFSLDQGEHGWHVEIFDLWGAMVRDLGGAESGPGPAEVIWDGRDDRGHPVVKGGYVVLLLKSREDGVFSPSVKHLLVVR